MKILKTGTCLSDVLTSFVKLSGNSVEILFSFPKTKGMFKTHFISSFGQKQVIDDVTAPGIQQEK